MEKHHSALPFGPNAAYIMGGETLIAGKDEIPMNAMTKPNGRKPAEATIKLDRAVRSFLRTVREGQSISLAAWAAQVLHNGFLTDADLTRCFRLGFAGE
jgi:hypothetical protein